MVFLEPKVVSFILEYYKKPRAACYTNMPMGFSVVALQKQLDIKMCMTYAWTVIK